jgi:arylsulfatase A-like enzyme
MRFLIAILFACTAFVARGAERPNVLVVLCDDLGYGDPHCYNPQSKIPTPHIDRLAAEGVRFTDAHTPSSVCTPTRYGLLTGRYCWRTELKRGVLDGFDAPLIEAGRATLASFLKGRGYDTACIGKWHLGLTWTDHEGKPLPSRPAVEIKGHRGGEGADFTRELRGGPMDCGFDSWFGISASLDMSPYAFIDGRRPAAAPTEHMAEVKEQAMSVSEGVRAPGFTLEGVLPEFTRRAVALIESRREKKAPFFLYFPLNSPHLPVVPSAEHAPVSMRTRSSFSPATMAASGTSGSRRSATTCLATSPLRAGNTTPSADITATRTCAARRRTSGRAGIACPSSCGGRRV